MDPTKWTQQQAIAWTKMLDLIDEMIANEKDPVKYDKYNRRHKALRKVLFPDAKAWWNE
jgi:hypothetical protein